MSDTTIISHIYRDDSGDWHLQSNDDHCLGTAAKAQNFAAEFGMGKWGYILGILHDRGKERDGFQCRIRCNSGYDKSAVSNDDPSHSIIGASLVCRLKEDCIYWLSNPIAGHHRGLYDTDELENILHVNQKLPVGINTTLPEISLLSCTPKVSPSDAHHITRMLFSCLVDADRLDTERFMNPEQFSHRGKNDDMYVLKHRLDDFKRKIVSNKPTPVDIIRTNIQNICAEKSALPPGIFSLTVPTGGGKTLASVIWAVNHAVRHGKKRIIIAIPFTSIIVQTAHTLRNIFGAQNVLEHHSAIADDSGDDKSRAACENWDAPIVVTTNVQLFESIFSNNPSRCRRLHAICNSIVILDEAQSIPLSFLQPAINAIRTYSKVFSTSFLLCTATQPVLDGERNGAGSAILHGLDENEITPIIDPGMVLHEKLRRVSLSISDTPVDYQTLCTQLTKHNRVLCIVNTRRHALEIYRRLPTDGTETFHLSRMMCPAHILQTIERIKQLLMSSQHTIRVVSTQLIEAGVDIDFPVVYRQMAGLDSILQAAGRCNREGRIPSGEANIFTLVGDKPYGAIGFAADTMKRMLSLMPDSDWFDQATIREYYRMLYANTPSFDKESICNMLANPRNCRYEEASRKFRLIDDDGIALIVNYDKASELVDCLRRQGPSRILSRQLGRYCVAVRQHIFNEMQRNGLIEQPAPGFYFVSSTLQYDPAIGLKTDSEYLEQTLII